MLNFRHLYFSLRRIIIDLFYSRNHGLKVHILLSSSNGEAVLYHSQHSIYILSIAVLLLLLLLLIRTVICITFLVMAVVVVRDKFCFHL